MGWQDWWFWEARAIECLWQVDRPDEGLARLSHVVEDVRRWSPADGELTTRIDDAFAAVAGSAVPGRAARTLPEPFPRRPVSTL